MKWLRDILRPRRQKATAELETIRARFAAFLRLLERNNEVLKAVADLEEKAQGEYLFDLNYVRQTLGQIRTGVSDLVVAMVELGGEEYEGLQGRFAAIDREVQEVLPENRPVEEDDYTLAFEDLGRERAFSVGSKSAQLGEMKSVMGLPVPEGFAISAWAYKRFLDANGLQTRISAKVQDVDVRHYEDLVRIGQEIRALVIESPVPEDLTAQIRESVDALSEPTADTRFSLRSSALGEDTLYSFAGQYTSFLNVDPGEVVDRYRDVVASKFTPQAIYYLLSHGLSESELAMGVCCMAMVDAQASGVVYSRDPVEPEAPWVLVNAIRGLGQYLVDGTLTPDEFRLRRGECAVQESHLAEKPVRLVLCREGGTREETVPEAERREPSVEEPVLLQLCQYAAALEDHYGCPQDIEWAVDAVGQLHLLQTRPLQVLKAQPTAELPDMSAAEVLRRGGTTICPGAGGGPVCHVSSAQDLARVTEGTVVVAPHPFPALVTVMDRVSALVTEVGGVASHLATLAREQRLPALAGVEATASLPAGQPVTVDATTAVVYAGLHEALIESQRPEYELFEDTALFGLLERVLSKVSPLNLVHPGDEEFTIENCRTFHDLTRFAHQRAMDEMFTRTKAMEHAQRLGVTLRSDIPLQVYLVYLDREPPSQSGQRWVEDTDTGSQPMTAFWSGIKEQGWPARPAAPDRRGFASVLATHATTDQTQFSQTSFAVLSEEYMLLSLRLGYHFTTIEAMCTPDPNKNYARIQHKGGGASLDRRIRRLAVIGELLSRMGFEHASKGDFLDSSLAYQDAETVSRTLRLLGRLTILTKQLDMALSNEALAEWYAEDLAKQLGLTTPGEGPS